jgi:rod shape determining protein RodA
MAPRRLDSRILLTVGALVALGLATLYSAGQTDVPTEISDIWQKQLGWIVLATAVGAGVYRVSPRLLEWATPFVYGLAVVLLMLTLVVGTGAGTAAGTKSWLAIGGMRIGQPAELAKLATIMMLARHLGGRRRPPQALVDLLPAGVIVGVPFLLVGLQPDLGSAIVFLGIFFVVLFWVGAPLRLLVLLASPVISLMLAFSTWSWGLWIVAITLLLLWARPYVIEGVVVWLGNVLMGTIALQLWRGLAPYQQNRLLSFLNPEIDPRATGWNIIQSKVAIGSGGLLGKGFLEGTQKALAFLPAQHTDFIFSVLAEELGFVGVMVTLALFAAVLTQLMQIARTATDPFSSVLVFGICGLLFTHVVENVGMSVGLMPITGIPLPFFSYGGSFLLISFVAVAMCLRVARESRSSYTGA